MFTNYLIPGLLKALAGRVFSTSIDRCGFDFAQSGKRYEDSSDSRRFFVNVVLFIVFPFSFWCKCFAPSDCDLLAASTEWQCAVYVPSPISSEHKNQGSTKERLNTKKLDKDEDIFLSQVCNKCFEGHMYVQLNDLISINYSPNNLKYATHLIWGTIELSIEIPQLILFLF